MGKEGKKMKKALLATMFVAAGSLMAAPRVAIGIGIGAPAPVAVVRPACPGPGYSWVNGYYGPNGVWIAGYWAPPAVAVVRGYDPHYVRPGFVPDHHFDHDRAEHREFRR